MDSEKKKRIKICEKVTRDTYHITYIITMLVSDNVVFVNHNDLYYRKLHIIIVNSLKFEKVSTSVVRLIMELYNTYFLQFWYVLCQGATTDQSNYINPHWELEVL